MQLLDIGIGYGQIVGRGRDHGPHGRVLHQCPLIVGPGLHDLELILRTFDHDKGVALVHKLKVIETDLLYKPLHT